MYKWFSRSSHPPRLAAAPKHWPWCSSAPPPYLVLSAFPRASQPSAPLPAQGGQCVCSEMGQGWGELESLTAVLGDLQPPETGGATLPASSLRAMSPPLTPSTKTSQSGQRNNSEIGWPPERVKVETAARTLLLAPHPCYRRCTELIPGADSS